MKIYHLIGADGGGTKTRVAVCPLGSDELLFDRSYGPSNYQTAGESAVTEVFRQIAEELRRLFGTDLDRAVLAAGLAGVDRPKDAVVYRRILQNAGFSGPLAVYNDMDTALAGAHAGGDGLYLNCGTGSIAVGRVGGRTVRAGGWGALFGDEGSGYRLGLEAVTAVFRAYDRVGPATCLTELVLDTLGLSEVPELLELACGAEALPVGSLASLAPLVTQNSDRDGVCRAIVDAQAELLAQLVSGVVRQLDAGGLPLALGGSLLIKSEPYRVAFLYALSRRIPSITVRAPLNDPIKGALTLARRLAEELEV